MVPIPAAVKGHPWFGAHGCTAGVSLGAFGKRSCTLSSGLEGLRTTAVRHCKVVIDTICIAVSTHHDAHRQLVEGMLWWSSSGGVLNRITTGSLI